MKNGDRRFPKYCWLLAFLFSFLLPAAAVAGALALQEREEPGAGGGIFALVFLVLAVAGYAYFAVCLSTIASKTKTENGWYAWIPILNVVLMLNIAQKPLWWFLLMLIPLVNIIIGIIVWMAIAEARGKPNWWGILMIVPLVNFVVPGYLAFSD